MKMMLNLSVFVLTLASSGAFAQVMDKTTFDQALTEQEGMTRLADGFYAKHFAGTQSYVATTPAGQRMLVGKLTQLRANAPANSDEARDIGDLIAKLTGPQPKNQTTTGYCSGTSGPNGPLYVQALAGGGIGGSPYGASATAINSTSPLTSSTNFASGAVYDQEGNTLGEQDTTTHDATAAYASAYNNAGCTSSSAAQITCAGYSTSLTAFAFNQRTNPVRCIPQ